MFARAVLLSGVTLACACAAEIPAGTNIDIRLTTPISSSTNKAGDPISAVVISPVLAGNQVAIPQGTVVNGKIRSIAAAKTPDDPVTLTPEFTSMRDSGDHTAHIAAKLVKVDNARESVDEHGQIVGIVPKQTISARLDQGINKISQQDSGFGQFLGAIKGAFVKETDPNINYAAGVEMTISLTKALEWTPALTEPAISEIEPPDRLAALVNTLPFRTFTETRVPSDVTNLMFIGSREELEQAFREAGWTTASALSGQSKLETFRAIAEMRGYQEAPVSLLVLNGRPPDLVFQKQNNTFAARHHLRIWHMPERFNDKDVWVCGATHDTGIDFSEENRTFIHKIESDIDRERAKVVSDLLFTHRVKALALVERDNVPKNLVNGTGDPVETDGRMAVIEF